MELERALHLLGDQQELEHKISSIEPEHAETVASPMDRFLEVGRRIQDLNCGYDNNVSKRIYEDLHPLPVRLEVLAEYKTGSGRARELAGVGARWIYTHSNMSIGKNGLSILASEHISLTEVDDSTEASRLLGLLEESVTVAERRYSIRIEELRSLGNR